LPPPVGLSSTVCTGADNGCANLTRTTIGSFIARVRHHIVGHITSHQNIHITAQLLTQAF
jgi:hypothetical protein